MMANIKTHLDNIKNAVFGKDVRDSIHDAIKTCYDDASIVNDNANMEVKIARGVYDTLGDRLNEVDSQLEQKANEVRVDELERQIGQGVTDERLNNAVQSKISDGTIPSLMLGVNSVKNENILNNQVFAEKTNFILNNAIYHTEEKTIISSKTGTWLYEDLEIKNVGIKSTDGIFMYVGNANPVDNSVITFYFYTNNDDTTHAFAKVIDKVNLGNIYTATQGNYNKIKIRFWINTDTQANIGTRITFKNVSILKNTQSLLKYLSSDIKINRDNLNFYVPVSPKVTNITVKPDGSCDFTNPLTATRSITNSNENNIYNIYIHEGDYNIYSSWISSDYSGVTADAGWRLPNYVNLIGVGDKNKIICRCELPDDADATLVQRASCLNLSRNNNIENITFISKNTRYTVHDESSNYFKDWTRKVKNCTFIHNGNKEGFWEWHGAWCEGCSSGSYSEFEDCEFIGVRQGYGFHNNIEFTKPSVHKFKNCKFENNTDNYACIFESLGSGQRDKVLMEGCSIKGAILLKETISGCGIDIELEGYGNSNVPVLISTSTTNQYTHYFSDEVIEVKNNTETKLNIYTPITVDIYGNAIPCTNITLCNGIVAKDILQGEKGYIQNAGYIKNYLNAPIGSKIGIVDGNLSVVNTNEFIGIVTQTRFIKLTI